jgi:DNA polymerase-3 subunit delta'
MVAQEGADQAANAFLKLLEEPPADTTIILTSSEPGALLPTVRSRVAAIRVPCLTDDELRQFIADPIVAKVIAKEDLPKALDQKVALAAGAPGRLLAGAAHGAATEQAQRMLNAATSGRSSERIKAAMSAGSSKARGAYSDSLDALNRLLHERLRAAADSGRADEALKASRAIANVERTRFYTTGNVNPQLLTAALLDNIARDLE